MTVSAVVGKWGTPGAATEGQARAAIRNLTYVLKLELICRAAFSFGILTKYRTMNTSALKSLISEILQEQHAEDEIEVFKESSDDLVSMAEKDQLDDLHAKDSTAYEFGHGLIVSIPIILSILRGAFALYKQVRSAARPSVDRMLQDLETELKASGLSDETAKAIVSKHGRDLIRVIES